ncbi:Superoxide-generating NADPH oxidase heavy chain subunit C [Gossypium arboreum]|uniref:Superoxide-generating NADPH oxidase heavy chain subunit C n=1 Tax=Gossypium arboreum TaxID=29729 RepID=A0A0B0N0F0_GOSAR|nr:Superoxide-generating NADPH oxidase heavy chain subunit C [Gossypium arboreum]
MFPSIWLNALITYISSNMLVTNYLYKSSNIDVLIKQCSFKSLSFYLKIFMPSQELYVH